MKRIVLLIWILLLSLADVNLAAEGTWTRKADMPTARYCFAASEVNGKIYAIGGWDAWKDPTPLATVEMYDPATDTWERKADMPTARGALATAVLDEKIYVIGGARGESPFATVEIYDPITDTWEQGVSMSTGRWFLSAVVLEGRIYAIGGVGSSSMEEYSPETGAWTRKANMPTSRWVFGTGVVNGRIYVIGGDTGSLTSSVLEYDPTKDSWIYKVNMPTVRAAMGSAVMNGKIYVIGGNTSPGAPGLPMVEVYDPATDTWENMADIPTPRSELSAIVVNGRIYAIGGATPTLCSTVEEYTPPLIVDFNYDGIVDSKDVCMMIDCWGTGERLYDIAPQPSGDGIVDVQDLALLAEYLFQQIDDPTLVAHWAFDEPEGAIALDSVGDNIGYVMGDPVWQPETGRVAGAIEFDGVDDVVIAGSPLNPADGPFSALVWVKGGGPGQAIISEPAGPDWLSLDPVTGCLMTELVGSGRGASFLVSATTMSDGNWHRVGFVWDGAIRTLLVDGVVVAQDSQNNLQSPANGLYIGAGKAMAPATYFSGLIDDVRIYRTALTGDKIVALSK